ncbi:MAG: alpha-amylase/4-alpha-glucanotransferase domain-containing protein, partial [Armatimonadota bacterium]
VEVTLPPCALWVVPIEVVSASEAGFERSFQGASLWFLWPLRLDPGGVWDGRISCALRAMEPAVEHNGTDQAGRP